jgi:serine phosphatase RsbU (regulator of sigma subunit)
MKSDVTVRREPSRSSLSEAPAAPTTETYRILLVEDDAEDALLVRELLADTGLDCTLRWEKTLADALAALGTQATDCVLLDLHLPDASGTSFVGAVQAADPGAAVVVLTGLAESAAGVQAVAAGAQDYLVKGLVDPHLLGRVVRYAVHRKLAERAGAELLENRIRAQENARLERGLLPAPLVDSAEITVTTRYLPSREHALLGGDFLDVVQADDGTVHAIIGDVSGHGPDEAALGVCLRIAWRALVLAGHRDHELLDLVEQVLVVERTRDDTFATCCTVSLEPGLGTAAMFLAGHHEALLTHAGGTGHVPAEHGTALGILPGRRRWTRTEVPLPRSGALMLYTDGLIEGYAGPGDVRLGTAGLVGLIRDAPDSAAGPLLDHVVNAARRLNAGRHVDDLAILHLAWDADG